VNLHIRLYVGRYRARDLRAVHVEEMVRQLKLKAKEPGKKKVGPRTIQYAVSVLRRCLNWAIKRGKLSRNVAQHVETPRVIKRKPIIITPTEARALLDVVRGDPLELIFRLAMLAMRKGEALGLLRRDVDLENQTLRVSGTSFRALGKSQRGDPKSEAARLLYLPDDLCAALKAHIEARGDLGPDNYVFIDPRTSKPVEVRRLHDLWKRALKAAGLNPKMVFHDTRHSAASWMIAEGVHPRVIQGILGHASYAMTMSLYGHMLDDVSKAATSGLGRLLERGQGRIGHQDGSKGFSA
jgi:integrase